LNSASEVIHFLQHLPAALAPRKTDALRWLEITNARRIITDIKCGERLRQIAGSGGIRVASDGVVRNGDVERHRSGGSCLPRDHTAQARIFERRCRAMSG